MSNRVFVGPAQDKVDVIELAAAATLLPGTVGIRDDGEVKAAGAAVAGEFFFVGNNILGERTVAYSAGATAQCYRPSSGQYYALRLAAGQTIAAGAGLTTNATGLLVAAGENDPIVYADEDVTTTTAEGVIRVRVA